MISDCGPEWRLFRMKHSPRITCFNSLAICLLTLGASSAHAQFSFCNGLTLPRSYVTGGSNEVMGDVALVCTSVAATPSTLTVDYFLTPNAGSGMLTSSLAFVVAPTRTQSGSSITFTFTPSSGDQTFSIFGVGVNATFITGTISAGWSGSPFFFTSSSGSVGIASTESNLLVTGIKGRVDIAGGGTGAGGTQVLIPISARMFTGVTANSLSFQLTVSRNGTAPALSGTLSFNKSASLPAPGIDTAGGSDVITVTWGGGLSLTGTTALGNIVMTIPANVSNQNSYTLRITQASSSVGTIYAGPTNIVTTTAAPKKGRRQLTGE
jgi:hypothetical protein